eukprot:NODE_2978_length_433_cov_179.205729_g2367_i0.p1 GENE.NODE_2978_length_433_cov_179.205729_g2367_i0~~NODE_2978_length_433_cov_179.205729_g2367_i0.p1  ORF type:complete len:108 (-),score=13.89 NODE_2978_length_433_cov_179.205729_g2367_i0:35-358(-)
MSAKALADWLATSEISNVSLNERDVQDIVNVLLYDGFIEEVEDMSCAPVAGQHTTLYKIADTPVSSWETPLTNVPCGTCPVFDQCGSNASSLVSPLTCPYLTEWLDF